MPATSLNVVRLPWVVSTGLGGAFRPSAPPPSPPAIRRARNTQTPISSSIGASEISRLARKLRCCTTGRAVTSTLCDWRVPQRSSLANAGRWVVNSV